MYLLSGNQNECYGCFGCTDVCSADAITIVKGADSYYYPQINTIKCVSCGKCKQVCPNTENDYYEPIDCISGIIKDEDAFHRSSSGGAFEAIIKVILNNHPEKKLFVAGAVWNEKFNVVHELIRINTISDITPFNKSKYVQSKPDGIYRAVKAKLKNDDNLVVFSGTPCQVTTLLKQIGKKPENLITIDLICHGCPSQDFFDKYREELEQKHNSKLVEFNFRNKEILDNGTLYTRSAKFTLENGKSFKVTRHNDSFLKSFYLNKYLMREACIGCKFKTSKRVSDFTICDAWGIEKLYPEINGFRGVSVIIFNSDLSMKYKNEIAVHMNIYETPYSFIVENNSGLYGGGNSLLPKKN